MKDYITALALFVIAIYTFIAFPFKDYLCSLDGMRASYYNHGCITTKEQLRRFAND